MARAPQPVDVPAFATTQLALLARELQAEVAETSSLVASHAPAALERAGLALTGLVVASRRTGLGGRTVVELGPDPATRPAGHLAEHGIRTGDIVLAAEQPSGSARRREVRELERRGVRGVVVGVQRRAVAVALDDANDANDGDEAGALAARVWVVKLADEVTHRR